MPVRSLQIVQARYVTAGLRTAYTCPAGKTCIVKQFSIYTGAADVVYIGVQKGAMRTYFQKTPGTADSFFERAGFFIVLEPADLLVVNTPGTGTVDVLVSGAELDGVAP